MLVVGMRDVVGQTSTPMLDGIAGLGHVVITVSLIFFFVGLANASNLKHKSILNVCHNNQNVLYVMLHLNEAQPPSSYWRVLSLSRLSR